MSQEGDDLACNLGGNLYIHEPMYYERKCSNQRISRLHYGRFVEITIARELLISSRPLISGPTIITLVTVVAFFVPLAPACALGRRERELGFGFGSGRLEFYDAELDGRSLFLPSRWRSASHLVDRCLFVSKRRTEPEA